MKKTTSLAILIPGLILSSLVYLVFYWYSDQLTPLTREDGPIETVGALLFLVNSVLCFRIYSRVSKSDEYQINKKLGTWVFFIFGVMFFFAFAEEISYGQRIIGFETPEELKVLNNQDEFNIHNLEVFYEGGNKTALITPIRLFALFGLVYMVFLPLAVPRIKWIRDLVTEWSIPIPVSILPGILFIYNLGFCKIVQTQLVVERNLIFRGMLEIAEAFLLVFLLMMFLEMYKNPYPKKSEVDLKPVS